MAFLALDPARACAGGDLRIWAKPGGAPIHLYSFFFIHIMPTNVAWTRRGGEGVLGARMRVCSRGMPCGSNLTMFYAFILVLTKIVWPSGRCTRRRRKGGGWEGQSRSAPPGELRARTRPPVCIHHRDVSCGGLEGARDPADDQHQGDQRRVPSLRLGISSRYVGLASRGGPPPLRPASGVVRSRDRSKVPRGARDQGQPRPGRESGLDRHGGGAFGSASQWPHVDRWRENEEQRARRAGTGFHHGHAPKRGVGTPYAPALVLFATVTTFVLALGVNTMRKHYARAKAVSPSFPLP